jgi:hypothetical protein
MAQYGEPLAYVNRRLSIPGTRGSRSGLCRLAIIGRDERTASVTSIVDRLPAPPRASGPGRYVAFWMATNVIYFIYLV